MKYLIETGIIAIKILKGIKFCVRKKHFDLKDIRIS